MYFKLIAYISVRCMFSFEFLICSCTMKVTTIFRCIEFVRVSSPLQTTQNLATCPCKMPDFFPDKVQWNIDHMDTNYRIFKLTDYFQISVSALNCFVPALFPSVKSNSSKGDSVSFLSKCCLPSIKPIYIFQSDKNSHYFTQ